MNSSKPIAEERKQTTATFGGEQHQMGSRQSSIEKRREEQPAAVNRDAARSASGDNKPKLFKGGGTNPFAKRTGASGPGGFGGIASGA